MKNVLSALFLLMTTCATPETPWRVTFRPGSESAPVAVCLHDTIKSLKCIDYETFARALARAQGINVDAPEEDPTPHKL